jgi:Type I phosphodiesterase / nucleotide pyrophosphatase
MKTKLKFLPLAIALLGSINCCTKDIGVPKIYKAKNVIIIVIDGPRYSETFGNPDSSNIMPLWDIVKQGTLCTNMYNLGTTNTINGITAITTGNYGNVVNGNNAIPEYESIFQQYIEKYHNNNKAWIISSKDKIAALANCSNTAYTGKYLPNTDCGNNGLNTGYRNDSITVQHALNILKTAQPNLCLITFKEPDESGHLGDWNGYLNGIKQTAIYTKQIVEFLNTDAYYYNTTDIFITNDHGRHLDSVANGFISHGDACEGCKHISLVATGVDFKRNYIDAKMHSQIDIATTIAQILNLKMDNAKGLLLQPIIK